MKTYKFRLYPNPKIEDKLLDTLNICRQTYNVLLSEFQNHQFTKFENQSILPNLKICDHKFKQVHSKVLQYENYRLFSNLKALTEIKGKGRKVGRLRFKGKNWFKTFTYNQTGFKLILSNKRNQTLWLSKIGNIPVRVHRPIEGKIKQVTLKKEASGKWFASITAETKKKIMPFNIIRSVVGIDFGTIDTVYDSDGRVIKNPKFITQQELKIKQKHKQLSKKKKGSNNRLKSRIRLARQYEHLRNSRDDFVHKQSHFYVTNYDAIGMEDFNISIMNKGSRYAKSNYDACWGKLRQYIIYKAENAGKLSVLVDYWGTTQLCSQCGNKVPKKIWNREHKCSCGFEVPRDYNSALEIKNRTLKELGQELSKVKPVEIPLTGNQNGF